MELNWFSVHINNCFICTIYVALRLDAQKIECQENLATDALFLREDYPWALSQLADFIISGGAAIGFCIKSLNKYRGSVSISCLWVPTPPLLFFAACATSKTPEIYFPVSQSAKFLTRACIDLAASVWAASLYNPTTWQKNTRSVRAGTLLRRQSACEICAAFFRGKFFLECFE